MAYGPLPVDRISTLKGAGDYQVTVVQTDQAGNISAPSDAANFTVDLAPPLTTGSIVNGGAEQRTNITSLKANYDEAVVCGVGALTLTNTATGQPVDISAATFDSATGTWDLSAVDLADGYYTARISAGAVEDLAGNPMSEDYTFSFHRLAGDTTGDGSVDAADYITLKSNFGRVGGAAWDSGDLDGDGDVDWSDLQRLMGSFGTRGVPNTAVVDTKLKTSIADVTLRSADGPGSVDMLPQCVRAGVVFGTAEGGNDVYTWTGSAWSKVGDLIGPKAIWCMDGDILIAECSNHTLHRSINAGVTWAKVADLDVDSLARTGWSMNISPSGTAIFTPYGGADSDGHTQKTWRATAADGYQTWTGSTPIICRHIHTCGYHVALARWVLSVEPNTANPTEPNLFVSDDDGLTWVGKSIKATGVYEQPVKLVDYGHATRMLMGSDSVYGVAWMDVSDNGWGSMGCLTPDQPLLANLCYDIRKFGDLWYAATHDTNVGANNYILVSQDAETWVEHYRFANGSTGIYWFAGQDANGDIWATMTTTVSEFRGFSMAEASAELVNAIRLDPAATNLAVAPRDSGESSTPVWTEYGDGTISRVDTDSLHGDFATLFNVPPGGTPIAISPGVDITGVAADAPLVGSVWIKGQGRVYVKGLVQNPGYTSGTASKKVVLNPDRWVFVASVPMVRGENGEFKLMVYPDTYPGGLSFYLDCFQVEVGSPSAWHSQAAGARAADVHDIHRHVGASWTEIVRLWLNRPEVIGADMYIRTWRVSDDIYASLWFQASDDTLRLTVTDGVNTETLYSSAQLFDAHTSLMVAVSSDAGEIHCHVASTGEIEEMTRDGSHAGTAEKYALAGMVVGRYGNVSGASGAPCWLHTVGAWDEALTATQIAANA